MWDYVLQHRERLRAVYRRSHPCGTAVRPGDRAVEAVAVIGPR